MPPFARSRLTLFSRLLLLSALFTLELVLITLCLDGQTLIQQGGWMAALGLSGSWLLRCIVAFAALFATFAFLRMREHGEGALRMISGPLASARVVSPVWFTTHIAMLAIFALIARSLFGTAVPGPVAAGIALVWLAAGIAAIATGALALIPLSSWRQLARASGSLWIYALATSVAACLIGAFARNLWASAAGWTFILVKTILAPFLSGVFTDLSTLSIGTKTFSVEIAPQCSGLEGSALILGFCALWLWLCRREFRFPQALLLAPASVAILFFLNAVRIAALIMIGNAGEPDIALGGFHSQAGWIAFNAVAIALMMMARRVQWITVSQSGSGVAILATDPNPPSLAVRENPGAPYLAPFLLILVAAMISRAASAGGFEWLYPLRLFASGTALWIYRARYRKLDWHFGWQAPAVGILVFALWLGGDWLSGLHPQNPLASNMAPASSAARQIWLALRILSSILTVPIAEELAFRGYLIRRIVSEDFERLSLSAFTPVSLIVSSLAFGILHGERWILGTVAGLLYAAVLIRRGRIGDSVVAHATTNALLAASVLVTGQWNLS